MLSKNVTVGKKIAGGFGVVLLVLILVVALNYLGVGSILNASKQVIAGNKLMGHLVQTEIDHLNWTGKINALLTDDSVAALEVETDDRKCELGKWLKSKHRKKAESLAPGLAALFKILEKPHRDLH